MMFDKPSWGNGREQNYGSLQDDARRTLTLVEIKWNDELRHEEQAASASAATPTTPAAAYTGVVAGVICVGM